MENIEIKCPECGQTKIIKFGWKLLRTGKTQQYQCKECAKIFYFKSEVK
jgi:transposase-like protein